MLRWLVLARAAAAVNLGLLLILGGTWLKSYRQHRASHTLGLLVVAVLLLAENALWLYFYTINRGFVESFTKAPPDLKIGMALLCGLESAALLALVRVTWM